MINVSKYNNNYINRFLARIEKALDADSYVHPDEVKMADAFYSHQAGIVERKATRLINKVKKENGELDKELEALGLSTEVTEEDLTEATA